MNPQPDMGKDARMFIKENEGDDEDGRNGKRGHRADTNEPEG